MRRMILYGVGAGLLLFALLFGLYSVANNYLDGGLGVAFAQGTGAGDGTVAGSDGDVANGSGSEYSPGDGECYCNCNCGGSAGGRFAMGMGRAIGRHMFDGRGGGRGDGNQGSWNEGRGMGQGQGTGPRQGMARGSRDVELEVSADDWVTLDGKIAGLDRNGMTLSTGDGETIVVRLGPEWYWTEQGVTLAEGDDVSVRAFFPVEDVDGMAVAGAVTLVDTGQTLTLRGEDGGPLWMDQAE